MKINRIKKPSVVQQVIDCLTEAIISKELKPGDQIPTEQMLADQLGVARNSVREAVKILVFMGVLEIRRPEGTFVSNGFSEDLINPMIYGIILNQSDSYQGLMELREMIEVGVLRLAIQKADEAEIEKIRLQLEELRDACLQENPDFKRVFDADNAFHNAIDLSCGNIIVSKINSITRILTHNLRFEAVKKVLESNDNTRFIEVHEQIFHALCNKDIRRCTQLIRESYFLDGYEEME